MINLLLNAIALTIVGFSILFIRQIWGRKIRPQVCTMMWTIFLICAICPFSLLQNISWPKKEMVSIYEYYKSADSLSSSRKTPAADFIIRNFFQNFGFTFWLIGFGLFMAYYLSKILYTHIMLKRNIAISLSESENQYRIAQNPPICYTESLGPLVSGIPSKIYLPRNILQDEKLLKTVMAHETVHWKRKHYYILLLTYLLSSIYWFLPYVWIWFFKALREDMEFRSDYEALPETGLSIKDYERQIVKQLNKGNQKIQNISFDNCSIIKRFQYMDTAKKNIRKTILAAGLALTLFLTGLISEHYYFYRKDEHGFNRMDIHNAISTLESFQRAVNSNDRKMIKEILYQEYPAVTIDYFMNDYYDVFDIRYEPDTFAYYYFLKHYQDAEGDMILLKTDFHNKPENEGEELYHYGYGYWMLKDENDHWKIYAYGY